MSEFSKDTSRSLKLSPPRSLMNLEDAEEIWTIITKRYPKAAPLLCEMETVLDHAENLLEQLKSPRDLGIVPSTEESLHVEESEEAVSDRNNLCEQNVFKNIEFETPSFWETQVYNIDYQTIDDKNNQVPFFEEDSEEVSTFFSSDYTLEETDSSLDQVRDDRKETSKKSDPQHSEGSTQTELINSPAQAEKSPVRNNKGSRSSSASKILGNPVPRLLQSPRRQRTHSEEIKSPKKAIPKLKGSPRRDSNEAEVLISHFKKVVKTIKSKEESSQNVKKAESIKTDMETQEKSKKIVEIIRMKQKDSASIAGCNKFVDISLKSCETSFDQKTSPDDSSKSTKVSLPIEANIKIQSNERSDHKSEETTSSPGCDDRRISIASVSESPVLILEEYAKICNKTVDYITSHDRKGKFEITCNFANCKVPSGGKIQEVVKNEAAARMLHLLATRQMEENAVGNLPKFSRQEILEIINLDKGDTFIPSDNKMAMVKLYYLCLEQNLPEPQYEIAPDKNYGFLSTCKIMDYIGKGTGRTDATAKEKAAEDLYKKHFQKLKQQMKDH